MSIYFWFQFALLIAFLFISAPRGGMFLGLFSGIGLIVIMFGPKPWLGLPPGKPPVDVILTIIAVVAAGSTLQASGGLDCMLQIAEKILRKRPSRNLPGSALHIHADNSLRYRPHGLHTPPHYL